MQMKKIGILALQGSFAEHATAIKKCGAKPVEIRTLKDTKNINGIILPGGESTTLMQLLQKTELDKWLKKEAKKGTPIFGTCAGMIVLDREHLNLIDVGVDRNAYGRQLDSFEDILEMEDGTTFQGIFIRAPRIKHIGRHIEILARHGNEPVMAKENNIVVAAFHPELTDDLSVHKYFLSLV